MLISSGCLFGLATLAGHAAITSRPHSAEAGRLFETRIRPILWEKCLSCHGPALQRNGLRVDSLSALLKGGSRGPALEPGRAEDSLLIQAVRHRHEQLKMPFGGARLSDAQVSDLVSWVNAGAAWPEAAAARQLPPTSDRTHWAFQPVRRPALPPVKNTQWVRSPIDCFVLAGLDAKALRPAPPADRRILLRRAYFDLIGLPPTPEEIDAFLADRSPDAFSKVVDRLLSSPRYGERWGRHWLDCVRYADSNGLDENYHWANAWRYRDYVIDAFNRDVPYDRFLIEQLAGDLIPPQSGEMEADHYRRIVATGFLMIGPKLIANPDKAKVALDIIDEQIETTSRALLGLTIACARCHDHKFDPITQNDYYGLAGIFRSTRTMKDLQQRLWMERPLAPADQVAREQEFTRQMESRQKALDDAKRKRAEAAALQKLERELAELQGQAPPPVPQAMAVTEDAVTELPIFIRGDHNKPGGTPVPRHFPAVLTRAQPALASQSSGRLELALWIASAQNPLTARVMVNRIWQWHFGVGLVATSDNFGRMGERPGQTALLDYLAGRFMDAGWSLKSLHREILLSNTYQMSVAFDARAYRLDPDNRLHWRANRRRLEVEAMRDAILLAGGCIDLRMGGSLLTDVPNMQRLTTDQSQDFGQKAYATSRRSVYLPVVRNSLFAMFELFDFSDPSSVTTRRTETIVAPQALFLMNNPLILEYARRLARDLLDSPLRADAPRVQEVYLRLFGRPPSREEVSEAEAYLNSYVAALPVTGLDAPARRLKAWQSFCQTLFAANEFAYVD